MGRLTSRRRAYETGSDCWQNKSMDAPLGPRAIENLRRRETDLLRFADLAEKYVVMMCDWTLKQIGFDEWTWTYPSRTLHIHIDCSGKSPVFTLGFCIYAEPLRV